MLEDIANLFIYQAADYFIYLDARKNTYITFAASDNGTPLPPAICYDYDTEIIKYADAYVVP